MIRKYKDIKVTKPQLAFIILTDILIFVMIAVILFELKMKKEHIISFFILSFVFKFMGVNQFIYYKNNKDKKYLIFALIYVVIGLIILISTILKLFR